MKTRLLLLGMLFCGMVLQSQTLNQADAIATSGGLNAGINPTGVGKNTFYGYEAGKVTDGGGIHSKSCTFIGYQAGVSNTARFNTFVGNSSGYSNTSGADNTYIGNSCGGGPTTSSNTYVGSGTGSGNTTGHTNTFIGMGSGNNSSGNQNAYLGSSTGDGATGDNNIFLGTFSGQSSTGSRNVFLGYGAGYGQTIDDKLIISNDGANSLIYGDFATGKVGIGNIASFPSTSSGVNLSTYKLFVQGGILATEVRVSTTWSDYVFESDYKLPTLAEVEQHIKEKGHLINVPSGEQVEAEGIEVGQMAKIQQEKIEELTLYLIEQNKINEKQANEIAELKAMVEVLAKTKQ